MLKRYRALLAFVTMIVIIAACSKDKLETRPSIKIKSVNGEGFTPQQHVEIVIEFADQEGDLGDGWLIYYRNRTNTKQIESPGQNDKTDVDSLRIPSFPKNQRGDLSLRIDGEFLNEDPETQDTMFFKIIAKDVAGNVSDTIASPTIINLIP